MGDKKEAPTYLEYNGRLIALIPDPERPGIFTFIPGEPVPDSWWGEVQPNEHARALAGPFASRGE